MSREKGTTVPCKTVWWKWLRENIRDVVGRCHMIDCQTPLCNQVAHEVIADLDVFGAPVVRWVPQHLNRGSVVHEDFDALSSSAPGGDTIKFGQGALHCQSFLACVNRSDEFRLCAAQGDGALH